jgi:protein-tyrosine phosphatase
MFKQSTRLLPWEACYNARDLGGYATAGGGQTRWGAIVRADNLSRLTPAGQAALLEYGVRTVIDLRRRDELTIDINPFGAPSDDPRRPAYLHLPLGAGADPAGILAVKAAGTSVDAALPALYFQVLDHYWRGIAAIMTAIASAPDGAVLFHCHAGKDRTGLIAALLLGLAGVPEQTIAEDYALSVVYLKPIYDARLIEEPDPAKREYMARMLGAAPETMRAILAHLETRHGGAERYLLAAGVIESDIERLRRRIRA